MRRSWKIWLPVGSVLLLVSVCWYLWSRSEISAYSSKLEKVLAQAKSDGMPITPGELRQSLAVPTSDNAAAEYKQALGLFKSTHPEEEKELSKIKVGTKFTEPDYRRLGEILALAKPELDAITAASRKKTVDFLRPWENGPAVLFPEFADMKGSVKRLSWRAMLLSHQGKPEQALDDLETARRVAIHAGDDPALIGGLVQIALNMILADRLQETVNAHPTPAVIAKAKKILEDMRVPNFKRIVGGELIMNRICYQMIARDPKSASMLSGFSSDSSQPDKALELARFSTFNRAFEARTVELLDQLYRDLPKDPNDVLTADRALKRLDTVIQSDDNLASRGAAALLPVFSQTGTALLNSAVTKSIGLTAIRLLENHKPGAPFPDNLPYKTLDLFSGKPLIYKKTKTGFVLYSVGRNLKDDGGALSVGGKPTDKVDTGWRYPEGRRLKSDN